MDEQSAPPRNDGRVLRRLGRIVHRASRSGQLPAADSVIGVARRAPKILSDEVEETQTFLIRSRFEAGAARARTNFQRIMGFREENRREGARIREPTGPFCLSSAVSGPGGDCAEGERERSFGPRGGFCGLAQSPRDLEPSPPQKPLVPLALSCKGHPFLHVPTDAGGNNYRTLEGASWPKMGSSAHFPRDEAERGASAICMINKSCGVVPRC